MSGNVIVSPFNVDFANANAAASRINAWVAYKTHNNIRSLIAPESIPKIRGRC